MAFPVSAGSVIDGDAADGAAGSDVAEVTGLVGGPGVAESVIDGDPADGADGCSTVEHDAAANATATIATSINDRGPRQCRITRHAIPAIG